MALFGSFVASRPWLTTSASRNDVFALINNWGNRDLVRWGESTHGFVLKSRAAVESELKWKLSEN